MKTPILILHGWGSLVSGQKRFGEVKKLLEERGFHVFTPDLPGFGKNTLKKEQLFFDDYIDFVKDFLKKRKIKKVILIGHSFGGRIGIIFASRYPRLVSKLILVDASGIPHPLPSIRKKAAYITTKVIGPLFAIPPFSFFYTSLRRLVYFAIGEMDYYKAGKLSKTFKNVYQVDVQEDLGKITVPTCIMWGEKDTITPVSDAYLMHEKIQKSQLVIIQNASHKLPYENPQRFVKEVLSFIS